MKETVGERIKRLREQKKASQLQLATYCGVSRVAVTQWESGGTQSLKGENLIRAAEFLELSPKELLTGRPAASISAGHFDTGEMFGVPLAGNALTLAGIDGLIAESGPAPGDDGALVRYATTDPDAYALRLRGDLLQPRIRSGEFLIVEPGAAYAPGDDVLVRLADGTILVKLFLYDRGGEMTFGSVNIGSAPSGFTSAEIAAVEYLAGIAPRNTLQPRSNA